MNETDAVPVAVVGAGNMGSNHVRVYDELPEASLVEVVEPDPERAAEIRANYDVTVLDEIDEIEDAVAASIAVPNRLHRPTAEKAIDSGLDILVEKPLAPSVEDAEAIINHAKENNAILQVGHIERYNPAVQLLIEILQDKDVFALEAHRLGPFNDHLVTEDVIFDLMIHDIDVITSVVDAAVEDVHAFGIAPRSEICDHATAQLQFENGVLGTSTASHVTHGKIRELTVTTEDAYISLDYQEQRIVIQRRGIEQTTELPSQSGYRTETITETPYIRTREPLKIELEEFLSCVKTGSEPLVNGETGRRAVKLATSVSDAVGGKR